VHGYNRPLSRNRQMRNSEPQSPVSSISGRLRDALQDERAARPWLLTIVRREHARLYERKRLELVSLDDAIEIAPSPGTEESEDQLFVLRHAIMRLPIRYREPLVLQVLGGFSTEEIARELQLSSTAVLTRLFRARNKLRVLCGMTAAGDVTLSEGPA
jgi:RNA polymerase sigma-70 factor (ECF subfamily)